ncbi:hypothetical protein AAL_07386 [Moelleriella libera RCEF 2490]|uniref:AMP-dependent synthetase/ligase n=1 Tax=Moelleriella libera RCEF 2490 TaxID=1081109 RepID=A0A167XNG4_9HYPO|nr:hypothetical protein AAL_07386 [Moelleriella libera RCEF 2490]
MHPFYSRAHYPPDDDTIQAAREKSALFPQKADLRSQPVLRKKNLYAAIERLVNDTSPENTYRQNVYTSVTGGGSATSRPLFFATDALENRRHRAYFGDFLRKTGIIKRGDWVLTTHHGGNLYRSLDLTLETMENAGASVLAAGHSSSPDEIVHPLQEFNVNVLTGDGTQIVSLVHHLSNLTEGRDKIKLDKIIYTSEGLTAVQRAHIYTVLGRVKICFVLGSAEAGPYGASNPDLTLPGPDVNHNDFIIDTRMTLIEILPLSYPDVGGDSIPGLFTDGETGVIAQTMLTRLRNPVIRYLTGDVGSLHRLPEHARSFISEEDWPHFRILRLQGRDTRFSFMWDGVDFQFDTLTTLISQSKLKILQWQVILDKLEPSLEILLEIRLLRNLQTECAVAKETDIDCLRNFFHIDSASEHRFKISFLSDLSGFELSKTGRKVISYVAAALTPKAKVYAALADDFNDVQLGQDSLHEQDLE